MACRPINHQRGERLPVVSDFLNPERTDPNPKIGTVIKMETAKKETVLLSAKNVSVWFPSKKNFLGSPTEFIKAVDDVSFEVYKGETLGLVGESGCGKTTLGRTLLRLIEPSSGQIFYNGIDLTKKGRDELRPLRKDLQIVFQDPYSSLNPRLSIGAAIAEPLKVHQIENYNQGRRSKLIELLEKVNLKTELFNIYPH